MSKITLDLINKSTFTFFYRWYADSKNSNLIRMLDFPFIIVDNISKELKCENCNQVDLNVKDMNQVISFVKAHSISCAARRPL
jgi:hypothetical protein